MIRVSIFLWFFPVLCQAQFRCDIDALPELPDVRISSVELLSNPVPHCKASGVIGTEINFELLLPENWNGKFVMGGGGGFVGSVQNSAMGFDPLSRGFATVGTDTGHQAGGIEASWALHNMERLVNFGHQAVHRTAVTSKSMIRGFYGAEIRQNYFMGCSRGGGQALMEAQRYPDDFDAIVAGAPAYNWAGLAAQGIRIQQNMFPDPSTLSAALISSTEQSILEAAILARCDANDGITDGILNEPRQCSFDLAGLPSCAAGDNEECFTAQEINAIREVYQGPKNAAGNPLFYGFPFGGESDRGGWSQWMTGGTPDPQAIPNAIYGFSTGIMKYMVYHEPDWNYASYGFENFERDTALVAATLNATNPDLSAFRERGGKLLIYQGWSDTAISALATIGYFESVVAGDASAADDVKLFMMPGVLHCAGGKGPSQVNFLDVIDQWAESGTVPQRLTASYPPNSSLTGTRPLCAYPEIARYAGSGDDRDAANFSCVRP
jgi:hypothetical protein